MTMCAKYENRQNDEHECCPTLHVPLPLLNTTSWFGQLQNLCAKL